MPTICVFFGIVIRMYYDDHGPPHFHAYYGDSAVIIDIDTLRLRHGKLPRRALAMVLEWGAEHREELMADWVLAEGHYPLRRIDPLE
jgi:hypothetical protein